MNKWNVQLAFHCDPNPSIRIYVTALHMYDLLV